MLDYARYIVFDTETAPIGWDHAAPLIDPRGDDDKKWLIDHAPWGDDKLKELAEKEDYVKEETKLKHARKKLDKHNNVDLEKARLDYMESRLTDSFMSRFCAIGWKALDGKGAVIDRKCLITCDEHTELSIMADFLKAVNDPPELPILVVHHAAFDLPFYRVRAAILDRNLALPDCYHNRYSDKVIDTFEELGGKFGATGTCKKLGYVGSALGLGGKTGEGKGFYRMDRADQVEYLNQDVDMLHELALRLGKLPEPKQ